MENQLSPVLIGRNNQQISKETEAWQQVVNCLNELGEAWLNYFGRQITTEELGTLLRPGNPEYYVKMCYVLSDPERASFADRHNVDMEQYIKQFSIPDYSAIIEIRNDAVESIRKGPKPDEFWQWLPSLSTGSGFAVPDELATEIRERHSSYANTRRQLFVLKFMEGFCEYLNFLNNTGLSIGETDLPRVFYGIVETFATEKNYSELAKHCGDSRYKISNFRPGLKLSDENSTIYHYLSNLTDEQLLIAAEQFNIELTN